MSTTLTQPAWVSALLDTDLSFAERTVAAYLAWRQGRNGSAWPSQRTIAGDLGLTCDGVRKITQRLEAKGRLVATWSGPGRGRNHYKQYKITDPKKTQTAVPVLETGNPDSRLAFDEISEQENPDSRPKKTQTAVPRHIGRTQTWNTYRKETRARTSSPKALDDDVVFARFWSVYPKRVGKLAARKVWTRLRPDAALTDRIIAGVERYAQTDQWQRDAGRYIPNPATFLNQRRWEDEIEPSTVGAALGWPWGIVR
jgi:hypothetical protein